MRIAALTFSVALISSCAIASEEDAVRSKSPDSALRAQGKKIFVSRCAQCHNENAGKQLPDGTTLLQRLAKSKNLEARLQTRLKNTEESHAVALYIESLLGGPNLR